MAEHSENSSPNQWLWPLYSQGELKLEGLLEIIESDYSVEKFRRFTRSLIELLLIIDAVYQEVGRDEARYLALHLAKEFEEKNKISSLSLGGDSRQKPFFNYGVVVDCLHKCEEVKPAKVACIVGELLFEFGRMKELETKGKSIEEVTDILADRFEKVENAIKTIV